MRQFRPETLDFPVTTRETGPTGGTSQETRTGPWLGPGTRKLGLAGSTESRDPFLVCRREPIISGQIPAKWMLRWSRVPRRFAGDAVRYSRWGEGRTAVRPP